jgi:hypothetical protein
VKKAQGGASVPDDSGGRVSLEACYYRGTEASVEAKGEEETRAPGVRWRRGRRGARAEEAIGRGRRGKGRVGRGSRSTKAQPSRSTRATSDLSDTSPRPIRACRQLEGPLGLISQRPAG